MLMWGLNKKNSWRQEFVEGSGEEKPVIPGNETPPKQVQKYPALDPNGPNESSVCLLPEPAQSGRGGTLDLSVLLLSPPLPNPTCSRLYTQPKALTGASFSASPGLLQSPGWWEPIFVLRANSWSLTSIKIEYVPIPLLPPAPPFLE